MNNLQKRWDARWRDKLPTADWQPDPWMRRLSPLLEKGRALDVACGTGRNAIFLAENHFDVTAIDLSPEALRQLSDEAIQCKLNIKTYLCDLEDDPTLPAGPFDLVVNLFYLHRPLIANLVGLLRPGGLMLVRTFSRAGDHPASTLDPRFVLERGELLEIFHGWEILLHEEGSEPSTKGGSLAGCLARKPV